MNAANSSHDEVVDRILKADLDKYMEPLLRTPPGEVAELVRVLGTKLWTLENTVQQRLVRIEERLDELLQRTLP